jgi:hypothetical protein
VDGHRTAWRTAIRPPVARSDRRLDGGRPRRPQVGVAVGRPGGQPGGPLRLGRPPGAVRQGPSTRGRPPEAVRQGPSAQSKLWRPITIDLEFRFRRLIPFWNVQVMLYNMSYEKNLLKDIFSQNTVPLAVRCFNVACGSVSAILFF